MVKHMYLQLKDKTQAIFSVVSQLYTGQDVEHEKERTDCLVSDTRNKDLCFNLP